jgi:hypothetical protein
MTQLEINRKVSDILNKSSEFIIKNIQMPSSLSQVSGRTANAVQTVVEQAFKEINKELPSITLEERTDALRAWSDEILDLLAHDPNSPYYGYDTQGIKALALQGMLGKEGYKKLSQDILKSLQAYTDEMELILSARETAGNLVDILNGVSLDPEALAEIATPTLQPLARYLTVAQAEEYSNALNTILTVEEKFTARFRNFIKVSSYISNVSYPLLSNLLSQSPMIRELHLADTLLGYEEETEPRTNPLPFALPPLVKVATGIGVALASAWAGYWVYTDVSDKLDSNLKRKERYDEETLESFCKKVTDALSIVESQISTALTNALSEDNIGSFDPQITLKQLKNANDINKIDFEIKVIDFVKSGIFETKMKTINFHENCISGNIVAAEVVNVFAGLDGVDVDSLTREQAIIHIRAIANAFEMDSNALQKLSTMHKQLQAEAYEKSGQADSARRRRAITNLIEYGAYGAVALGVIWGLSKVYKGYASED